MTEAELVEFVTQYYPEWSVSQQEYQPTDIGSMNANMDLFKDESGLIKDWVLGLLTDSMDMGALQPVNEFDEEPPATPMSDWYMSSGNYEEMFTSLSNRETPETAAYNQYIREGLPDFEMDEPNKPSRFNELLNVAKQVLPEIAGVSAYEQRRDFAAANPTGLSPLQEDLQAAGIFTGPTPDEWYSDSILQDRENASASLQEFERLQALQDAFVEEEDRFAGSNPHQGALDAFLASQAPGTPEATPEATTAAPSGGGPRADAEILELAEGMTDGGFMKTVGSFFDPYSHVEHPDSFESGDAGAGTFEGFNPFKWINDDVVGPWAGVADEVMKPWLGNSWVYQQLGKGADDTPEPAPDRESWRGDPRDKRSHVGKVADWDYQKKMYEQTAGGRSKRKEPQDQKYFDAKRDSVWNAMKLDIEERAIAQARGSNNIQKQQILDRFLGLPRG